MAIVCDIKLILLLVLICFFVNCQVPVFIWETYPPKIKRQFEPSPLFLNTQEFTSHISNKVGAKRPTVVLFWTDFLSVEDFSRKDGSGQRPFPKLRELINSSSSLTEFLPSVENPISSVKAFNASARFRWTLLNASLPSPTCKGIILEVKLNHSRPFSDRDAVLREFDQRIDQIYSSVIRKRKHTLCMLTSKMNPWIHLKEFRNAKSFKFPGFIINAQGDIVITSSEPPTLFMDHKKIWVAQQPDDVNLHFGIFNPRATVYYSDGDRRFHFRFIQGPDSWKLDRISMFAPPDDEKIILFPHNEIAGNGSSPFTSDNLVTFTSANKSFAYVFSDLRVSGKGKNETSVNHLVSPGILSGYLVMSIILSFFIYAMCMLLDIRTMDRFDDPKGKQIIVITN